LAALPVAPLRLPLPTDARARRVADALLADPADGSTVDQLARRVGTSRRTVERLFRAETRVSFGRWRQRMRLVAALRLLAAGEPVTQVAHAVGYATPSAFSVMFARELGVSPARYFHPDHGKLVPNQSGKPWRN
jgi:AraC-like DNA-binding protein